MTRYGTNTSNSACALQIWCSVTVRPSLAVFLLFSHRDAPSAVGPLHTACYIYYSTVYRDVIEPALGVFAFPRCFKFERKKCPWRGD
jgi:hypothetical protein